MPLRFINGADEVLPGLWIGDASSCAPAHEEGFNSLCVLEGPCGVPWANLNPPLLVHCGAGVERSPLTVVWWMRRRFGLGFDTSYVWLQKRRPCIADRRMWIR
jgi:hypothetical protein